MPGWWFTIESTTTRHFIHQFKIAIEDALKARPAVRAIMRARAVKQRFPVSQWVEDLEKLQSSAIEISHRQAVKEKRPTLDSPSTPAILETPGLMSVLQSRLAKPTLRPHHSVAGTQKHNEDLTSIAEGNLLIGPGPGLGSKLGPSSRRKAAPPPLLRSTTDTPSRTIPRISIRRSEEVIPGTVQRPFMNRAPSAAHIPPKADHSGQEITDVPRRPSMFRSPSMPQIRPKNQKAVKMLGMQVPTTRTKALNVFTEASSSGGYSSTLPSSATSSPTAALSADTSCHTPISTPPSSKRGRFSIQNSITTATSVSDDNPKVIHTPHAVDMFPSLGPHYFPHGAIDVLSTTEIKEEKPDNLLQNVTPFFSDSEQKYEAAFVQKLKRLNGKNSENELCIEEYLLKSEKLYFGKLRAEELSKPMHGDTPEKAPTRMVQEIKKKARDDKSSSRKKPKSISGLERFMRRKIGDWPIYSFLLAFVSNFYPGVIVNLLTLNRSGPNHSSQFISNHTA